MEIERNLGSNQCFYLILGYLIMSEIKALRSLPPSLNNFFTSALLISCFTIAILSLVGLANFFLIPASSLSSLSFSSGDKLLANLLELNSLSIFFNSAFEGSFSGVSNSLY